MIWTNLLHCFFGWLSVHGSSIVKRFPSPSGCMAPSIYFIYVIWWQLSGFSELTGTHLPLTSILPCLWSTGTIYVTGWLSIWVKQLPPTTYRCFLSSFIDIARSLSSMVSLGFLEICLKFFKDYCFKTLHFQFVATFWTTMWKFSCLKEW